jgi:hypothetical protein
MGQPRKTDSTADKPPYTFTTMHDLLRDAVFKMSEEKRALDDPATIPAIIHLMHVANFLQRRVRFPHEKWLSPTALEQALQIWVDSGENMPPQRRQDREDHRSISLGNVPGAGSVPFGAIHHRSPVLTIADEGQRVAAALALAALNKPVGEPDAVDPYVRYRQHVSALLSGKGDNRYCARLREKARTPLLVRPIKKWKDYAWDVWQVFLGEFGGETEELDSAAHRFIRFTAKAITGETAGEYAVPTYLSNRRQQKRR